MKNTKVVLSNKKIEKYSGELLVTFVSREKGGKTVGHKLLRPIVGAIDEFKEFTGQKDQCLLLYRSSDRIYGQLECRRLMLLGLGDVTSVSDQKDVIELLRTTGGTIAHQCKKNKLTIAAVLLPEIKGLAATLVGQYLLEGILLGAYQFQKYQKPEDDSYSGLQKVEILTSSGRTAVRSGLDRAINSTAAACDARDMANEPGNFWTPLHFAKYAQKVAKEHKIKCTILEKSHMAKLKMGGILAVNKGSKEPPKVIILDYNPKKDVDTVLLVGKGLTFDSGGISLKPAQNMMDMKYDMCGGAAVLTAIAALATEKIGVRVVAIVPSTDNMAGGGAVKPGDVITHYGGITSEIENTDAEGRLILADALSYGIEKYQPDCVIDLATLTGAVIIALGHHHTGLLCNNDQLADRLIDAGNVSGEPLWRLPLGGEYAKQLKSQVADLKNTGGRPAGCITAGEYLHAFVGKTPWAHLDIAGTAWDFTEKTYIPKGPSGIGVRTLIELLRKWENRAINKR